MKTIANLLTSLIIALWVVGIAILSVQNATPISLTLFGFRTIQIPFGLVLAFTASAGVIGTSVLLSLGNRSGSSRRSYESDDADFFVDDDF